MAHERSATTLAFAGKTFSFTGTLPKMSRTEAQDFVRKHGGLVVEAVTPKLDYLVMGETPGTKFHKAKELGRPIISEAELLALVDHWKVAQLCDHCGKVNGSESDGDVWLCKDCATAEAQERERAAREKSLGPDALTPREARLVDAAFKSLTETGRTPSTGEPNVAVAPSSTPPEWFKDALTKARAADAAQSIEPKRIDEVELSAIGDRHRQQLYLVSDYVNLMHEVSKSWEDTARHAENAYDYEKACRTATEKLENSRLEVQRLKDHVKADKETIAAQRSTIDARERELAEVIDLKTTVIDEASEARAEVGRFRRAIEEALRQLPAHPPVGGIMSVKETLQGALDNHLGQPDTSQLGRVTVGLKADVRPAVEALEKIEALQKENAEIRKLLDAETQEKCSIAGDRMGIQNLVKQAIEALDVHPERALAGGAKALELLKRAVQPGPGQKPPKADSDAFFPWLRASIEAFAENCPLPSLYLTATPGTGMRIFEGPEKLSPAAWLTSRIIEERTRTERDEAIKQAKISSRDWLALIMERVFDELRALRGAGQMEYARDDRNAFANFERVAEDLQMHPNKVLWTYTRKHLDGIVSWLNGHHSQREPVQGRINDVIVYLCILRGMIEEDDAVEAKFEEAREKAAGV